MRINRLPGWLGNSLKRVMSVGVLVCWCAGLHAISSGEDCVSSNPYGCCDCQFEPTTPDCQFEPVTSPSRPYDCRYCQQFSLRFQCDGYSNTPLTEITFGSQGSDQVSFQAGHCVHESYSYCRNGTGEVAYCSGEFISCILSFSDNHFSGLRYIPYPIGLLFNSPELTSHSQLIPAGLSYPLAIPLNQGSSNPLPMALFNLTQLSPGQNSQGGLYLEHRLSSSFSDNFSDKAPGSWSTKSTFVNSTNGLSLFLAGPLALGQALEIRLAGFGCKTLERVARNEHLGQPSLSKNPPALIFSWHNVTWPEALGSVNVTTPDQQSLNTTCLSVAKDDLNCNTSLANTVPMGWLLIRAGSLADAETLNFTGLAPLWQIPDKDWDWTSNSQQLTFFWNQPPVAAEGFQFSEMCQDGNQQTTLVSHNRYEERYEENVTGDCRQNCSFRIAPVYQAIPRESLGLELPDVPVAILCTPTHMMATTAAGYTATPLMTVTPTTTTGIAPATTGSPAPDAPNSLTPNQWAVVAASLGGTTFAVAVLAAVGCYIKYRTQTKHGEWAGK